MSVRTSRAGLRAHGQLYRAVIAPLLVAITQNPSRSEMASTRPIPGTTSPVETSIRPDGLSKTATPSTTSLTNQRSTFLGSFGAAFGALFAFATVYRGLNKCRRPYRRRNIGLLGQLSLFGIRNGRGLTLKAIQPCLHLVELC